jgi:hypothetical protein
MIPPNVSTLLPQEGGTFTGDTIVIRGSLVGMLMEQSPPQVWEVDSGEAVPVTWSEEVTGEWYAESPEVGGDIQTRVDIVLATVTAGKRYRIRYPSDLQSQHEVVLTAC